MSNHGIDFRLFATAAQVATATTQHVLAAAQQAITARGRFQLVLAGGRTPQAAYTLLVDQVADWDRWHIFFGDERCLAPHDPARNSVAAARILLDKGPIPIANWHPIPAEQGAELAATRYEALLRPRLPFDLALLGMGEDGHTASLFPGHPIPPDRLVMPVRRAPKPPPERVSLTPDALVSSRDILILVTGSGKREAVANWRRGGALPIAQVASAARQATVLLDREAAGE